MPDIGHVRIDANNSIGRIKIGQQRPTIITNPNKEVNANIYMDDIVDVSTTNVQNGYVLAYNSLTELYEFKDIAIDQNIRGGIF